MRNWYCLAALGAAISLSGAASAQFTGPTPLAWRWAHSTPVSPMGAPVVDGGTIYVAVGNRMFGLDKDSGNQRWRYPLVEPIPGYFRSGPVLIGRTLICAADNKFIYAVDADTGNGKWSYPTPVPVVGQPVAAGNRFVFQMTDGSMMALNGDDGQPVWQAPYRVYEGLNSGLAAKGDNVFYTTHDGQLVAFNVNLRTAAWKQRFSVIYADTSPTIWSDYLYLNNGTYLTCISATSGGPRWQQNIGEQLAFSPAVSTDATCVVTLSGKVMFFDSLTGQPKRYVDPATKATRPAIDLGSNPVVRPSAVDKLFLVPTSNGALNFIDPATGDIIWNYVVRPMSASAAVPSNAGANVPGGGGKGGLGGGTGGGGFGGGFGGGQSNSSTPIIAIPASGPAVLAGRTLLVLCQDGSLLAFDSSLGVDRTGPTVTMNWPLPGAQVSSNPLDMTFKIEDDTTGVNGKTLKISANGTPLEFEFGRDGYAFIRISTAAKNKPLRDGRVVVNVTVSDWMGNTTSADFSLTVDNTLPPLARPSSSGNQAGGPGGKGGLGGGG